MKYFFFISILIIFLGYTHDEKKEEAEIKIKVGKVEFKEQDSGNWAMIGKVINVNDFQIQGNVEVALFNKNDQTISQFTTLVDEGDPIAPGDSGVFKYTADKSTFAGATRYHVQFVTKD